MKKLLTYFREQVGVKLILVVQLLVVAFALAAALRPAAAYTFTADQWESIALEWGF